MKPRRTFLTSIGAVGTLGIAGCTTDDNDETDPQDELTTAPNETHTHEPGVETNPAEIEIEQEGNDVYIVGETTNLSGRPVFSHRIQINMKDQLGEVLGFESVEMYGLRHGDTWRFVQEWNATMNEKRALAGGDTETSGIWGDASIPLNNSDECGEISEWMCDDTVKIASVNEEVIATDEGEEWTVYGELENISDKDASGYSVVAHYIDDGKIIAGERSDAVSRGNNPKAGETENYRIRFDWEPFGDLRMSLFKRLDQ